MMMMTLQLVLLEAQVFHTTHLNIQQPLPQPPVLPKEQPPQEQPPQEQPPQLLPLPQVHPQVVPQEAVQEAQEAQVVAWYLTREFE